MVVFGGIEADLRISVEEIPVNRATVGTTDVIVGASGRSTAVVKIFGALPISVVAVANLMPVVVIAVVFNRVQVLCVNSTDGISVVGLSCVPRIETAGDSSMSVVG
jgi:predicted metallopeptidase